MPSVSVKISVSHLTQHCLSLNRFHPSPAPVITIFAIFAAFDTLLISLPQPQQPLSSSIHASITVTPFTTVYPSLKSNASTYCTHIHSHISPVLKSLNWLKVEQRFQYMIISITHNLLHITEPKYLHRLINIKPPSRTRSSDHLSFPSTCLYQTLPNDHSAIPFPAYGTLSQ